MTITYHLNATVAEEAMSALMGLLGTGAGKGAQQPASDINTKGETT